MLVTLVPSCKMLGMPGKPHWGIECGTLSCEAVADTADGTTFSVVSFYDGAGVIVRVPPPASSQNGSTASIS